MDNMKPEISPSEMQTENKIETALIRKQDFSMKNGGGGRYQLLMGAGGTFGESMAPAGAAGPSPAES